MGEISNWYLKDIAAAIENAVLNNPESTFSRVVLVLEYIENNIEISRLLMHENIDETFAQRLFSLPKIESLLLQSLKTAVSDAYYQDTVSFIIYGSYKLIIEELLKIWQL